MWLAPSLSSWHDPRHKMFQIPTCTSTRCCIFTHPAVKNLGEQAVFRPPMSLSQTLWQWCQGTGCEGWGVLYKRLHESEEIFYKNQEERFPATSALDSVVSWGQRPLRFL